MIVTCPNCQTRYNLPDDKVPPGGAKVKCSKCAHVFKAEPPATPEEEVETLLEEETPVSSDTSAGDAFDETFDEVSSGSGQEPAEEEPVEEEPAVDEPAPTDDMPDSEDMDDLFGNDEEEDGTSGGDPDVDSLFGDDDDIFGDDDTDGSQEGEEPESETEDAAGGKSRMDDIFSDDDDSDDVGSIFAGDDGDEADEDEDDDDEGGSLNLDGKGAGLDLDEDEPVRSRKSLGCLIVLLILVLLVGGAVWLKAWRWFGFDPCSYVQNVPYVGKLCLNDAGEEKEAAPGESPADRVRNIVLKNVKQYYVANEKTGNLFVVEGKAVNQFTTPKERIKVEVVLYDGKGNVLTSQTFLCGNMLSQFQLQVQTRAEIEEGLKSEVGILSNNTFIRPGSSSPFMAVFFEPPAGVKEFLVKVVDVADPK